MTSWYAAHIILYVEFKHGPQDRYPAWENIVLIEAGSEAEALEKADRRGRSEEGDDDGSMTWGGKPARWVFAGVRHLVECEDGSARPGDGTELSYNDLELGSLEDVKRLAAGEPVQVSYTDPFRPIEEPPGGPAREAKRQERSGA